MEITEVRIKLIDNTEDRLRGFCSITFDDAFVVRDLKIIEGNNGPFVAMPSRKLTANCHKCRTKNHLRASYCNHCGSKVRNDRVEHDAGGRAKLYADVAHPVNAACREMIQNRVIEELNREFKLSQAPGYSSRYDDDYFDDDPGPALQSSGSPAIIDVPEEILEIKAQQEKDRADARQRQREDLALPGRQEDSTTKDATETGGKTSSQVAEGAEKAEAYRIDPGSENPHSPHKQGDDLTDASKSSDEEFGKGVFE